MDRFMVFVLAILLILNDFRNIVLDQEVIFIIRFFNVFFIVFLVSIVSIEVFSLLFLGAFVHFCLVSFVRCLIFMPKLLLLIFFKSPYQQLYFNYK
jgi:hypothetical protein